MIIIHIIDDFLFNLFILSLTHAFQFRDLFGYDMSPLFKATAPQMKTAKEFYADYLKYQKNDRAIEAHELIRKWAKVLKVDSYFSLVEESEYRNNPLNPPLAKGEVIASEANDLSSSVSFPLVGNRSDSPLIKGDRGLFKKDSGQANSRLDVAAGVTDAGTPPIPTLAKANSRCLKQG